MIIGIDGNEANEVREDIGNRVGVNYYTFEILWGMYKILQKDNRGIKFEIFLKNSPKKDLPTENSYWKYTIIPGKSFWILKYLQPYLIRRREIEVFFSPNHYLPFFTGCPKVCTIHDLGYLKNSEQFLKRDLWQLKYWSAISIIISKYIICPSFSTKQDIVRHYPFASKKVNVIHHGYDCSRYNTQINNNLVRQVMKKYKIGGNYILFLGTLKPNKNIEGLIEAFHIVNEKFKSYRLIIAGRKGWLFNDIFKKVKEYGMGDRVIFTDYVDEEFKPALISGAKLFILPSFWEGFGMEILNAMACGVPVVLSKAASLPEVAGDAGIYFDPNNIKSIAGAIEKVLKASSKEYNKLVNLALLQSRKFNWEKSAKDTLEILMKSIN